NAGAPLSSPEILGRSLWDFVRDVDTQHIYRLLHRRVRGTGAPVRLHFRCDAPALRRLLALELSAVGDERLAYHVRIMREEARISVRLLEPHSTRSDEFVTVCSWCNRVAAPPEGWLEVEQAVAALGLFDDVQPPQLTHGICGACDSLLQDGIGGATAEVVLAGL
ncbi:MAG: hypothetical protein ABI860_11095, partial [Gemmatimonadales bacterium]